MPVWAAGAVLLWRYKNEEARWRDLTARVPAEMVNDRIKAADSREWWDGVTDGNFQRGRVELQNHDAWYYAFASHHLVGGPDSYTVFRGKTGVIRFKGEAFCCEVDFGERKQPADTEAFIALLRHSGDEVEVLK